MYRLGYAKVNLAGDTGMLHIHTIIQAHDHIYSFYRVQAWSGNIDPMVFLQHSKG